jgi:hypothetical protein
MTEATYNYKYAIKIICTMLAVACVVGVICLLSLAWYI